MKPHCHCGWSPAFGTFRSARQIRADLGELRDLLREMQETRRVLAGAGLEGP